MRVRKQTSTSQPERKTNHDEFSSRLGCSTQVHRNVPRLWCHACGHEAFKDLIPLSVVKESKAAWKQMSEANMPNSEPTKYGSSGKTEATDKTRSDNKEEEEEEEEIV